MLARRRREAPPRGGGYVRIWVIQSHVPWLFVCFVRLQALTVFIIFSLVSLVGVSGMLRTVLCHVVTLRGFSGFSWGFRLRLPSRLV